MHLLDMQSFNIVGRLKLVKNWQFQDIGVEILLDSPPKTNIVSTKMLKTSSQEVETLVDLTPPKTSVSPETCLEDDLSF